MNKNFILQNTFNIKYPQCILKVYKHLKTNCLIYFYKTKNKKMIANITVNTPNYDKSACISFIPLVLNEGSKKYPYSDVFNNVSYRTALIFKKDEIFNNQTHYSFATYNKASFNIFLDVLLDTLFNPLFSKNAYYCYALRRIMTFNFDTLQIDSPLYFAAVDNEYNIDFVMKKAIHEFNFKNTSLELINDYSVEGFLNSTYEKTLATYKKFYQPSNMILSFYGDLDIDNLLDYLDKEYLSKYGLGQNYFDNLSEHFKLLESKKEFVKYPSNRVKNIFASSFSTVLDPHKFSKFDVEICKILLPLIINKAGLYSSMSHKNAYLDRSDVKQKEIFTKCEIYFSQTYPCVFSLNCFKNTKYNFDSNKEINHLYKFLNNYFPSKEDLDDFRFEIKKKILNIESNEYSDFDVGELKMMINFAGEKNLKDSYYFNVVKNLMSFLRFSNLELIAFIKLIFKEVSENFKRSCIFIDYIPSLSIADEREEELNKKIQEYQNSLTISQTENIIKDNISFLNYSKNYEKRIEKTNYPFVEIKDLNDDLLFLKSKKLERGFNFYHFNIENKKTCYFSLIFDLHDLDVDSIHVLSLFTSIFDKLPNCSHSSLSSNKLSKYALKYNFEALSSSNDRFKKMYKFLSLHFTCFVDDFPKLIKIISNLMFNPYLEKHNLELLIHIALLHAKHKLRDTSLYCSIRSSSLADDEFSLNEHFYGFSYINYLQDLSDNFDSVYPKLINDIQNIIKKVFSFKRFNFSLLSNERNINRIENNLRENIVSKLNKIEIQDPIFYSLKYQRNEAFISNQVKNNTVSVSFKLGDSEIKEMRDDLVQILLMNKIYDDGQNEGINYHIFLNIFDLQLVNINVYLAENYSKSRDKIIYFGDYLNRLVFTEKDLFLAKIEDYSDSYQDPSLDFISYAAFFRAYVNYNESDVLKFRKDMLDTSLEDVSSYIAKISSKVKECSLVAFSNPDFVKGTLDSFTSVTEIKLDYE